MTPPLSDEHIALLEAALANVENDYRPTCESINYGSGCPGPTDASLDFWRRAVDALPALLAEVRHRRSRELSAEDAVSVVRLKLLVHEVLYERRPTGAETASQRAAWNRLNADLSVLSRLCAAKEGV